MLKLVVWTQFHFLEMEWQKMVCPDLDLFFLKRTMVLFILWISSDSVDGQNPAPTEVRLSRNFQMSTPWRIPLSQPPLKTFVFFLKHGCTPNSLHFVLEKKKQTIQICELVWALMRSHGQSPVAPSLDDGWHRPPDFRTMDQPMDALKLRFWLDETMAASGKFTGESEIILYFSLGTWSQNCRTCTIVLMLKLDIFFWH